MRLKSIVFSVVALTLVCSGKSFAQQVKKGWDYYFVSGLTIGATTPVPVPSDLKITSYNPKFNPKLGANVIYFFDDNWGVGTGLTVDWKGMNIHTRVTNVHLSIDVPDVGELTGYVTGRGTTKVSTIYLTQPIYGVYRFNSKWQIKAGIYLAENLYRKFKGDVHNVKLVEEKPTVREREISYATLDYSSDVRKFEVGMLMGGEFRLNNHWGFFGDFTWGLTPYFSKTVPIHFTMRNIYLSLGATYRIR